MSYPRNAATPPRVAVGPVVQISDGAVQTSGVSIRVVPQGESAAAGLGTTTYEDGIVLYAPTQAESNYEAFAIIAYKSGCIPASTTVVTSASATAGYGGVDWSKVTSATSTVNLSGTTIATSQAIASVSGAVGSVTGNVGGNVVGSVGSISGVTFPSNFGSLAITVGGAVTAGTVSDKTGYSLASNGLASVTAWTVNITGSLSGSVGSVTGAVGSVTSGVTVTTNNDKTGYSLTQAFPANFGSLGINASGHISRVVLVDTTTNNTDMRGTDGAALATHWTPTRAGYLDGVLIAANYNQRTVSVTGANHVAADIHELQPAVIDSTHFAASAIDANALAADAAAEVASAVRTNLATELGRIDVTTSSRASQTSVDTLDDYVDTEVAAIKAKTDGLPANPAAVSDIPTTTAIADMVLSRSVANVETSAAEHTLCTLILAGLESSITGTTWTIRRTGGTTHYTKTVTTDSGAAPVVGVT